MSDFLNITIRGLDTLQAKLTAFQQKSLPAALELAISRASELLLRELQINTPVDTGNLRSSERVIRLPLMARIGPDTTKADYAGYVEYGHHTVSGSWVPGQYYLTRTALENSRAVKNIFKEEISNAINSI